MKNIWPVSSGLSMILSAAIILAGCGATNPSPVNTAPATLAYVFGVESGLPVMMEYSTAPSNSGTSVRSIEAVQGPIATDSTGQIYILYPNSNGAIPGGEIVVHPPNATGSATPSRTIQLDYLPYKLAVDPTGRVYVSDLPATWTTGTPTTVSVYAPDASGEAVPLRTFVPTNLYPAISDMVADAAGNLYVAGSTPNGWVVAVYPPTAIGPSTPARTIDFGADGLAWVYGVAFDSAGHIFANVCSGCYVGASTIEEFAPGASGAAVPIRTINLSAGSLGQVEAGGPVRVDGAGNIFTSIAISPPGPEASLIKVFYGFGPDATGDAVPMAQFAPPEGDPNGFLALN